MQENPTFMSYKKTYIMVLCNFCDKVVDLSIFNMQFPGNLFSLPLRGGGPRSGGRVFLFFAERNEVIETM